MYRNRSPENQYQRIFMFIIYEKKSKQNLIIVFVYERKKSLHKSFAQALQFNVSEHDLYKQFNRIRLIRNAKSKLKSQLVNNKRRKSKNCTYLVPSTCRSKFEWWATDALDSHSKSIFSQFIFTLLQCS